MMIDLHVIDLTVAGSRLDLYRDCLMLRRDVFISTLGWNLQQYRDCEFDQYDSPAAIHLAATDKQGLVACMRMQRTDFSRGDVSYMILDAHRGKIPNLPADIMEYEIVSDLAWEASRLAIAPRVSAPARNQLLIDLIKQGQEFVRGRGGQTMLGLMNPVFNRIFLRAGFDVCVFGRIAEQRDGRVCVLKWDFHPIITEIPLGSGERTAEIA